MNEISNSLTKHEHDNHSNNHCGYHYFQCLAYTNCSNNTIKRKNHINQNNLTNCISKDEATLVCPACNCSSSPSSLWCISFTVLYKRNSPPPALQGSKDQNLFQIVQIQVCLFAEPASQALTTITPLQKCP